MKCYYEILNVPKTVSSEELKKSYRKLALQWHPDKNLEDVDEAKQKFILIQEAYEVLSDPQERAWYDKHRSEILQGAGSGFEDDCLDIYPYFSVSCFQGFTDAEDGFYTVYREVFSELAAEEAEYLTEDDTPIPDFGASTSSYEVVNKFYGYWSSFCTKKSYYWMNVYQISEAENRRILRLMEQENKKVRDKAKKKRNEEIRALVSFVRKRDKRVQAHANYLKQKIVENNKKTEENRRKMIAKHRENIETYKESEWSKFSNLENELKEIESEFNDEPKEENTEDLFCVACSKCFKTEKAFANHEKSKKHQEKVAVLKKIMIEEDIIFQNYMEKHGASDDINDLEENGLSDKEDFSENFSDISEVESLHDESLQDESLLDESLHDESPQDEETQELNQKSSKKMKKKIKKTLAQKLDDDNDVSIKNNAYVGKKQRRKQERESSVTENCDESKVETQEEVSPLPVKKNNQNCKSKKSKKKNFAEDPVVHELVDLIDIAGSKKQKKKLEREKYIEENVDNSKSKQKREKLEKRMDAKMNSIMVKKLEESNLSEKEISLFLALDTSHTCAVCNQTFESKNKLFEHLKITRHHKALPIPLKIKKDKLQKSKHNAKIQTS